MPSIRIPETIIPVDDQDKPLQPLPFGRAFIVRNVLKDQRFGEGQENLYAYGEIRGAFDGAKEGELVDISHANLKLIQDALTTPKGIIYNASVIGQCKPYLDAVMKPEVP